MYDIWNPWRGCKPCSEGCEQCYMFDLEKKRGRKGAFRVITPNFNYPVKKNDFGEYRVIPGSKLQVCMISDFLFQKADSYREEIWRMIAARSDVEFFIPTKMPERFLETTPKSMLRLQNFSLNVSCENQACADARIPILRDIPIAHKGLILAPLLEEIHIESYLREGWIENVQTEGERGSTARECRYEWFESLSKQCAETNTKFTVIGTGANFYNKEGQRDTQYGKVDRKNHALDLGLNVAGVEPRYEGVPIIDRKWGPDCEHCGMKPICNGLNPVSGRCD